MAPSLILCNTNSAVPAVEASMPSHVQRWTLNKQRWMMNSVWPSNVLVKEKGVCWSVCSECRCAILLCLSHHLSSIIVSAKIMLCSDDMSNKVVNYCKTLYTSDTLCVSSILWLSFLWPWPSVTQTSKAIHFELDSFNYALSFQYTKMIVKNNHVTNLNR